MNQLHCLCIVYRYGSVCVCVCVCMCVCVCVCVTSCCALSIEAQDFWHRAAPILQIILSDTLNLCLPTIHRVFSVLMLGVRPIADNFQYPLNLWEWLRTTAMNLSQGGPKPSPNSHLPAIGICGTSACWMCHVRYSHLCVYSYIPLQRKEVGEM